MRRVLDYCGAAWQPWLSQDAVAELERAQAKAIRIVTGQLRTTPREALLLEMGVPEYAHVIDYLAARAYEKARRMPVGQPRRTAADGGVAHRTRRGSWRELAKRVCSAAGLGDTVCRPFYINTDRAQSAGWSSSGVVVSLALDGGSTRASPEETLKEDCVNTVTRISGSNGYTIYTDGSAAGGTSLGGSAAVVTQGDAREPAKVEVWRQK